MSDVLPSGWVISNLDQLTNSHGGGTPSKAQPAFWENGSVPWVSPKDMKTFSIQDSEDRVTEAALDRLSVIPPDSVLLVVRSGILSRTVPVAVTSLAVTINQDMRAFTPEPDVSSRFLAWQLVAKEQSVLAACSKHGTTVASLEGPALARFPIWLAPAAEQTRIVAKLEELLSDLDAGVAELKAAQKKLAQYRQSLLKAAVEGALTADWRTKNTPTETGAELLQRILTERRARWEAKQLAKFKEQGKTPPKDWQKKYPEPVQPDTTGLPELPEGWVWASLDQLTEFVTSGSRGWAEFYSTEGATFIRSQDIKRDVLDLSEVAFVAPPAGAEGARTRVLRDDLLLTITGANVGKCAQVDVDVGEAYVSQHVALMRPVDRALSALLHVHLVCKAGGRGQLDQKAYGAGKPGLNLEQVAGVIVPLPCPAEIPVLVDRLRTALDGTAAQIDMTVQALRQSTAQRQNILRAAFAGQLVPQDPNDEPASVLLERIHAEREARSRASTATRRRQPKVSG